MMKLKSILNFILRPSVRMPALSAVVLATAFFISNLDFISAAVPQPFPDLPPNCLDKGPYCSRTKVVPQDGKKYIQVEIFAVLDEKDLGVPENITNTYYDFEHWPEYIEGRPGVNFITSKSVIPDTSNPGLWIQSSKGVLDPNFEKDNREGKAHYIRYNYAHYTTNTPVGDLEVRELTSYRDQVESEFAGTVINVDFTLEKGDFKIAGVDKMLHNSEGIQYKTGSLFAKLVDGKYYIYSKVRVIPDLNVIPSWSAVYIERCVLTIFKGIFNL